MRTESCLFIRRRIASIASLSLASIASGALFVEAAAAAAPAPNTGAESSLVGNMPKRHYRPRVEWNKFDPVEALLPTQYRGEGLLPRFEALTGDFVVKFRDNLKARAPVQGGPLFSRNGSDLSEAADIIARFGGQARQWIQKSEGELATIEMRARENSGRLQPDLASMILVSGVSMDDLFKAALAVNALDSVEFVSISRHARNLQAGCDAQNPTNCERQSGSCTEEAPGNGDGILRTQCNPPTLPDPPGPQYGCNDVTCCNDVGEIDPACIDANSPRGWDVVCAAWANMICRPTMYSVPQAGAFNTCFVEWADPQDPTSAVSIIPDFDPIRSQFQNGRCDQPHTRPGCNQPLCCDTICKIDPSCCDTTWDQSCSNLALSGQIVACVVPDSTDGPSPDLSFAMTPQGAQGFQFYLQSGPRAETLIDSQGLGTTWVGSLGGGLPGFSGHGLALQEMDDFQQLVWEFYQGEDPANNPFLGGGGVRIGVLEASATVAHEDFILSGPAKSPNRPWEGPLLGEPKVVAEPDQSMLYGENGFISTNHGTNVLGVLVAADNEFGITGVAPNAQAFLFPLISQQEGFRAPNAMASAFLALGNGDVLNFSWGFQAGTPYFPARTMPTVGGAYPIVDPVTSDAAISALITVGSDLGITSVVAAGAGPAAILGNQLGAPSGAIIVTAVWPGNVLPGTAPSTVSYDVCAADSLLSNDISYIRYPGSNWSAPGGTDSVAAVSAWGYGVTTTGASTNYNNDSAINPEVVLYQGTNDVPPADVAPGLLQDRLRLYTQDFGGTSAAAAMVSGVVARIQASAKQFFGSGLSPAQVSTILTSAPSSYTQCICATGDDNSSPFSNDTPFGEDNPADTCVPAICNPTGCIPAGCACNFHPVGRLVNLQQVPGTILATGGLGSNNSTIDVLTGGELDGFSWSRFQISNDDNNFLRISSVPKNAGTVVRGLPYLSTGRTTDVLVQKRINQPIESLTNMAVAISSRASSGFVIAGAFIFDYTLQRYNFLGIVQLAAAETPANFAVPGDFANYVNPGDNTVTVRIWTCSIGVGRRYILDHDYIDVVQVQPAP